VSESAEINRIAETYAVSPDEARFIVRDGEAERDLDERARTYVAFRDHVRTVENFNRWTAAEAQRVEALREPQHERFKEELSAWVRRVVTAPHPRPGLEGSTTSS
jgi:hypothetical protein